MALDHFVSQVHLRKFYSEALGEAFYAIRKSELNVFHQGAANVCRIEDNSTNHYLVDERIVEEFLKGVEPFYNNAVKDLASGNLNQQVIYVISGFIAYILTCSPAGMRIQSAPLKSTVKATSKLVEKIEGFPSPPESLRGKSFLDLIEKGKIKTVIDPKYPQAIGIMNILSSIKVLGNSAWEILHNPFDDSSFFTSDFPICIEKTNDPRVLNKIVPLTPKLAIRILPNISISEENLTYDFKEFKWRFKKLTRKEVFYINRHIVRCAESLVMFRDNKPWVSKFVKKNSKYRIEPKTTTISTEEGEFLWMSQEIKEV